MGRPVEPDTTGSRPTPADRDESAIASRPQQARRDIRASVAVSRRIPHWPALALAAVSIVPALALGTWLFVAIPLLALDAFRPLYAVPLFLALVAPVLALAGRPLIRRAAASFGDMSVWSVLAVFGTTAGFVLTNGLLHAEKVILRRDAAAYSLFGHWLASHSEKVVPSSLGAFGGPDRALYPVSQGFYPHGDSLVPQFMSGLPATLAAVEWGSSWRATLWAPAVLGGLALLAFAGLAARLLGGRWAALATVVLALAMPFWHAARETLSEPMACVLLLGGLGLVADAARDPAREHDRSVWLAAATGGVLIAVSTSVRVDSLREATLMVPIVGWLAVRRSPAWWALAAGLATGGMVGALDGWFLTRPYVTAITNSLRPLALMLAAISLATAIGAAWLRRRPLRPDRARWLAPVAAWLTLAAGVGFAVRPLLQVVHRVPAGSQLSADIARLQREQGLAVDGTRSYDELSLHWLAWSVGWLIVAAAVAGAALLTVIVLRSAVARQAGEPGAFPPGAGSDRSISMWVPSLVLLVGSTALTLWRPGISPDHPWADRRFVPVVLPGVILLAVWAIRYLYTRVQALHPRTSISTSGTSSIGLPRIGLAAACLGIIGPVIWASAPLIGSRVEAGSMRAIERACSAVSQREVVFFVNGRGAAEWPAVMRIACGVNAAVIRPGDLETVSRLAYRAQQAGSEPVLMLSGSPEAYAGLGPAIEVLSVSSSEDQHLLARRPDGTLPLPFDLWMIRL